LKVFKNNIIASGGYDTAMHFWDLKNLNLNAPLFSIDNGEEGYQMVSGNFVPLNENYYACSNSRNINIYNRKNTNYPEKYLTGHYYYIHRVYKLNDNELFTVSGDDGVAKWNWVQGKKLF